MRLHTTSAAVVAVAAALSLGACAGEGGAGRDGSRNAAAEAPASPSAPGSASPGADGGGDTTASAPTPAREPSSGAGGLCLTSRLSFSSSGGMAEGEVLIHLENTGPSACSMRGFPGLDLKGEDGTVSAVRSDRKAPKVTLAPGQGTHFSLRFPPNLGGGPGTTFTSAVVTPPDETHAHTMPLSVSVPADTGSARRITVDPVGSGK
ncbi:DUF4232 domain-containing protein [Streptomyces sp. NBC_00059]|uniref:DUF4232 domain-containing protein n=1 Tax=Streptomyces sp. NBC_00059 TaxID=2975635 RepID=UPI0022579AEC|nr:DUF4232 domain-containing protein [Streptomyces sp. NBC_00059]MCX5414535.1 DUF4232 domain-containing protein [Streptomyces sp. NBC_00059]